jgi:hypothetical protein
VSIRTFVILLTRPTPIKLPRHDLSAAASSDFEDAEFDFFPFPEVWLVMLT